MTLESIEGLRTEVSSIAAPGTSPQRWCASARISGTRDGRPFTMVLDLFGQAFDTPSESIRYGALKAEARLLRLIEQRSMP